MTGFKVIEPEEYLLIFFYEAFRAFSKLLSTADIDVTFAVFFKEVEAYIASPPEWWPPTMPYQEEMNTDHKCAALAAILCHFDVGTLDKAFEQDGISLRFEATQCLPMVNDFLEARQFQENYRSSDQKQLTTTPKYKIKNWVETLQSPGEILELLGPDPESEHPAHGICRIGLAAQVCKTDIYYWNEIGKNYVYPGGVSKADLRSELYIEFAMFSSAGNILGQKNYAWVQIRDGIMKGTQDEDTLLLYSSFIPAVTSCIKKSPVIGDLMLVAVPSLQRYIVYSIQSAKPIKERCTKCAETKLPCAECADKKEPCVMNCPASGWNEIPNRIFWMNLETRKNVYV